MGVAFALIRFGLEKGLFIQLFTQDNPVPFIFVVRVSRFILPKSGNQARSFLGLWHKQTYGHLLND